MPQHDLLGRPLTETEREVLALYGRLKTLCASEDVAPCVAANARVATGALWQIVNDLHLEWEHLYDIGV